MQFDPGQVSAFMRHVYSGLGVATAVLGAVGLSQGDTTALGLAVHQIGDGIVSIATGIGTLVPIASGLYAAWTASHKSKTQSIAADPQTPPLVKQAIAETSK